MENVETVTVDSYTTLVDVGSQADVLEEYVPEIADGERLSQLWRSKYIEYSIVINEIDEYRPFWELIGNGLQYALEANGHDVSADVQDRIRQAVYEDRITVFDDVTDGIRRIVDAGYDMYVLSNGNPEMLAHLVAAADLEGVIATPSAPTKYGPTSRIPRSTATPPRVPILPSKRSSPSPEVACATYGGRNTPV